MSSSLPPLDENLSELEEQLWQLPDSDERLQRYQQAFRATERQEDSEQHHFIIVIPVADRPQHLQACLGSILQLCETYGYGGRDAQGRYRKVEVLVADDSRDEVNIAQHRKIAATFSDRGLTTHHFGQSEQLGEIARLDEAMRQRLKPIIGDIPADAFYHKGASLMRNITYLKLAQMAHGRERLLFYFIDSDQEFQVKVQVGEKERTLYAINYLYQLDRIFRHTDATILTGKVVGDPPVSPSVMAGNFLDDLTAFLQQLVQLAPNAECDFHRPAQQSDDAAYHDMAELFGFKRKTESFRYQCDLEGPHDHRACLDAFAAKLGRFFDGEHPTRKSFYQHQPLAQSIVPARTIYTGNYCFRPEALRYFIPFASLKLRMAGPVLGRIIKAEIGQHFISANLPMLHKRTVDELGEAEFRPGIDKAEKRIDLSGEFERQFFGDVMLFTMEKLTAAGFPQQAVTEETIEKTVHAIEQQMLLGYSDKHQQIVERIDILRQLVDAPEQWWNVDEAMANARAALHSFIDNMEANFGDDAPGYTLIHSVEHRVARRAAIIEAIASYRDDRTAWEAVEA